MVTPKIEPALPDLDILLRELTERLNAVLDLSIAAHHASTFTCEIQDFVPTMRKDIEMDMGLLIGGTVNSIRVALAAGAHTEMRLHLAKEQLPASVATMDRQPETLP